MLYKSVSVIFPFQSGSKVMTLFVKGYPKTATMMKKGVDVIVHSKIINPQGRFIILEVEFNDNIYSGAPVHRRCISGATHRAKKFWLLRNCPYNRTYACPFM